MTNCLEHIFITYFPFVYFFDECLFRYFHCFLIEIFKLYSSKCYFYVFWTQVLCQICDLQVLSPSLWLVFDSLYRVLHKQKVLILIKSKLSFFLSLIIWGFLFKNSSPKPVSPRFFS